MNANVLLHLPPDVLIRALWAVGISAGGLAAYWLLNRVLVYRAQKNSDAASERLPIATNGTPAILYFTTPECVPCKTVQRPALRHLQDRLGDRLQVIEVDAAERPDLARQWGVLSVPTTFIIDARGQIRQVNHGATRADTLQKQLEAIL